MISPHLRAEMALFLRLFHGPSAKGDGAVLRVGDPNVNGQALLKLAAAKLKLKPKGLLVVAVESGAPPTPPLRAGDALAVCTPAEADALRAARVAAAREEERARAAEHARSLPPEIWKLVIDFWTQLHRSASEPYVRTRLEATRARIGGGATGADGDERARAHRFLAHQATRARSRGTALFPLHGAGPTSGMRLSARWSLSSG